MTTVTINDPLTLPCGLNFKNRLAKGAMTEGLADTQNRATEKHVRLYGRWAKGGTGMLLTGNVQVDRRYLERPGNVVIEQDRLDDEAKDALKAYAAAGTQDGTALFMQISHAGRQTPAAVTKEPVGPSAVKLALPGGQFGEPRALTGEEIEDTITRFVFVAKTAKETGFSGVQVHAAHGYLLSEFLNPLANQRNDEWGGSLENRARLLLSVVRAIRAEVGAEYPISVKLNSSDFQKGGFAFEDCLQVVEWLGQEGIDLLEISGGNYEQPAMMGKDGIAEPLYDAYVPESTAKREAFFLQYAAAIQKVATMPLMVTGGFRTLAAMNDALATGEVDVIGIARPYCVEPDLGALLTSGAVDAAVQWEDKIRLGPGFLGPNSRIGLIKALHAFGVQGWFCLQLLRMGAGEDPDTKIGLLKALRLYQANESAAAAALVR